MTRAGSHAAPGAHLDEGTLVRRIDGELAPDESAAVEAHLATCAHCRAELEGLAALGGRVSASLRLLDAAPAERPRDRTGVVPIERSRAWHRSPIWRAAAAIALVAGLAIAIAPVRAWISERLGLGAGASAEIDVSAETPAGVSGDDASIRVAFVPTGDRFRVLLTAPQAEGALHLSAAPGDTASGEVLDDDGADLLVLPDGLGIDNHPFSTADYFVAVPRGMTRVDVVVAGHAVWSGAPASLPVAGRRIALDAGLSTER